MKTSILWNGFELKKGVLETEVGNIPYLYYSPHRTDQIVNIAIHGEGQEKEDWLCFNSVLKFGNLLKESIKRNSAFIAFDLYGHGEWKLDSNFNILHLSSREIETLVEDTIISVQSALPIILENENLTKNKLSVTGYSLGCSIAMGLKLDKLEKRVLLAPNRSYYSFDDTLENTLVEESTEKSNITESWIHKACDFIYS
ncbi:alpha/beta fold hydrolase [Thiospirochaeta perfilievii]|uniref:Alpha/beta fold hydrolase n=1 Tax=Thiospirochaeta perfilievii TaxID=252967 RepID=A0A5C1QFG5_9SPIO|nr:alpha/beta fold hydrolase [Thiospirochaeta perfilievii]QEN04942.1 alpha/beta fold hydrolase [Thiospirochaeta perfilievii]